MTTRKFSVAILALLAFPYVVLAIGNIEGERGPEELPAVEHAEKTESPLLKERTNQGKEFSTLRRLKDADVDESTDDDLRAAIKALAAQVRQLNERLDRLENPIPRRSTKSEEPIKNRRDLAGKLESVRRLRAAQAAKRVMLTYLESRSEQAVGTQAAKSIDILLTQTKQDLNDIALEIAILELSRESRSGRAPLGGVDREVFEMAQKGVATTDRELQRTLREVEELEKDVSTKQAELDAKKTEATRLRESREKLADLLRELHKTGGNNPRRTDD